MHWAENGEGCQALRYTPAAGAPQPSKPQRDAHDVQCMHAPQAQLARGCLEGRGSLPVCTQQVAGLASQKQQATTHAETNRGKGGKGCQQLHHPSSGTDPSFQAARKCTYVHAYMHHRHSRPMTAGTDRGHCLFRYSRRQALQLVSRRQHVTAY